VYRSTRSPPWSFCKKAPVVFNITKVPSHHIRTLSYKS
jgi:hypothetical protein